MGKRPRLLGCVTSERQLMEEQRTLLSDRLQLASQELKNKLGILRKRPLSILIKKWLLKQLFQILLHLQK